jgi:hypothetical protein
MVENRVLLSTAFARTSTNCASTFIERWNGVFDHFCCYSNAYISRILWDHGTNYRCLQSFGNIGSCIVLYWTYVQVIDESWQSNVYRSSISKVMLAHHIVSIFNIGYVIDFRKSEPHYLILMSIYGLFIGLLFPQHFTMVYYRLFKNERPQQVRAILKRVFYQELVTKVISYSQLC